MSQTIGVISDTHGLLRDEALEILRGCDLVIHAGDICGREIIEALQSFQRRAFVLGNMDWPYPGTGINRTEVVDFAGKRFFVLHDLYMLDLDPQTAEVDVVIHGHTHQPDITSKQGVLFFNPGSIGPKRRGYPVSMGLIHVTDKTMQPEIVVLEE